ncbi:hypothetical protein Hanom_Chr08g00738721 [Helianthus anomalus]
MVELTRKVLISEKYVISVQYWPNCGQYLADNIGNDILTDTLHRYLTRGPITDISPIYRRYIEILTA